MSRSETLFTATERKEAVTQYWLAHYINNGHCALCGNKGTIDTTGTRTPAGHPVGALLLWCICPNGQKLRGRSTSLGPQQKEK